MQRQELIRERARIPELEYIFKHELTREAAYNGILKKQRRVFHRQVAEALERLFPERIDEQLGLLAHHWERAEEPTRLSYLLRAGDQSSAGLCPSRGHRLLPARSGFTGGRTRP